LAARRGERVSSIDSKIWRSALLASKLSSYDGGDDGTSLRTEPRVLSAGGASLMLSAS
jgi:hypothetical protein